MSYRLRTLDDHRRCLAVIFVILLSSLLPLDLARPVAAQETPAWPLARWTAFPENPVFAGTGSDTWDRKIRERGYILVGDDGTFRLWYTGYAMDRPPTMSLGLATSRDGIHWNRDPENPIFSGSWVEDVCVVKRDGSLFMFAEGKNDIAHLLISSDGRKWTDNGMLDIRKADGSPLGADHFGTPAAWFENGTWFLFYERGDQGVWLATSKDMKIWKNVSDDPVLAMGPELYDKTAVAVNQIVKRDQHYYAFYHANAQRPWKDWTTCLARSRDLIHWEKYPGNPIIGDNCSSAILVRTPQGEDRLFTMHPTVKMFTPILSPAPAAKIESQ